MNKFQKLLITIILLYTLPTPAINYNYEDADRYYFDLEQTQTAYQIYTTLAQQGDLLADAYAKFIQHTDHSFMEWDSSIHLTPIQIKLLDSLTLNNPRAKRLKAMMEIYNFNYPENISQGISDLMQLGAQKDARSYNFLSKLYIGKGLMRQSYEWAKMYAELSNRQHNIGGYCLLADVKYMQRRNHPGNIEYIAMFDSCVKQENLRAISRLGFITQQGNGIESNYKTAYELYLKAAKLGEPTAMYNLGWRFAYGLGDDVNYSKAIEWFQKSALQHHAPSYYQLAKLYANKDLKEYDLKKSFGWLLKGAEFGVSECYCHLADKYRLGEGTEQNYTLAKHWYSKGANYDDPCSHYWLGFMFQKGHGVVANIDSAIHYFTKGTSLKSTSSMLNLADIYRKGTSGIQSDSLYFYWNRRAADLGDIIAYNNLGYAYEHGIGSTKNFELAYQQYEYAAENESCRAMIHLGDFYRFGYYVKKDLAQAKIWYQKSLNYHCKEAQDSIQKLAIP